MAKYTEGETCKHFEPGGAQVFDLITRVLNGETLPAPPAASTAPFASHIHPDRGPVQQHFATVRFDATMLRHLSHGGAIEAHVMTLMGPQLVLFIGVQK